MSDVGIIGSIHLVGVFRLLDVEVFPAENTSDAKENLEKIISEGSLKIIFVLESLACHMVEEMRLAQEQDDITVAAIPDFSGGVSTLDSEIRRLSKAAIGMEI